MLIGAPNYPDNKAVTCNKCGWVHFQVTLEYALTQIKLFGDYYNKLTPEEQDLYYGNHPSCLENYTQCLRCSNSYKNFRDAVEGDCPNGCTIGPILNRTEEIQNEK